MDTDFCVRMAGSKVFQSENKFPALVETCLSRSAWLKCGVAGRPIIINRDLRVPQPPVVWRTTSSSYIYMFTHQLDFVGHIPLSSSVLQFFLYLAGPLGLAGTYSQSFRRILRIYFNRYHGHRVFYIGLCSSNVHHDLTTYVLCRSDILDT